MKQNHKFSSSVGHSDMWLLATILDSTDKERSHHCRKFY